MTILETLLNLTTEQTTLEEAIISQVGNALFEESNPQLIMEAVQSADELIAELMSL